MSPTFDAAEFATNIIEQDKETSGNDNTRSSTNVEQCVSSLSKNIEMVNKRSKSIVTKYHTSLLSGTLQISDLLSTHHIIQSGSNSLKMSLAKIDNDIIQPFLHFKNETLNSKSSSKKKSLLISSRFIFFNNLTLIPK